MPKKSSPDIQQKVCDAALKLAATQPWSSLTLEQIAKAAKVSLVNVRTSFSSPYDVLPALVHRFDDQVAESIGKPNHADSLHDRIFDVVMTRLELLQDHRAAILSIMSEAKKTPALTRALLPAQWQSMSRMLALAGLTQNKSHQVIATTGLLSVYGLTLCVWQRDVSEDMAKTMASLDRYLRYADKLAAILLRNK